MEQSVALYARGAYRVVAAAEVPRDVWLVTDSAGTLLREEPSFDAARAWVDARQPEPPHVDTRPPVAPAPAARARRR